MAIEGATFRRFGNLIVTMILGGLWHGAGWPFVVWGALHAAYLCANHGWRYLHERLMPGRSLVPRTLSIAATFVSVVVAWVAFRATTIDAAVAIWKGLFGFSGISVSVGFAERLPAIVASGLQRDGFAPALDGPPWQALLAIAVGAGIVWFLPNTQELLARYRPAFEATAIVGSRWSWQPTRRLAVVSGLAFGVCILLFRRNSPFLYFQF